MDVNLNMPVMYVDRLRMRPPGDSALTLPPHIDGGGVHRWKDDRYRQVYRQILKGDIDGFDPFEIDDRLAANMKDFVGYEDGCTFFRQVFGVVAEFLKKFVMFSILLFWEIPLIHTFT